VRIEKGAGGVEERGAIGSGFWRPGAVPGCRMRNGRHLLGVHRLHEWGGLCISTLDENLVPDSTRLPGFRDG